MPLRNQPYLPLYIQDFITDEKLIECSASAHGVYIRLMCLLHKSEQYGTILLKQKYKQNTEQVLNFASQLAKNFPFDLLTIQEGLKELITEGVMQIEGDLLFQKRMVKDNDISEKRAVAGKKGGDRTTKKKDQTDYLFAQAKKQANPENEIEYENENDIENKDRKESVKEREGIIYPFNTDAFKMNWLAWRTLLRDKHDKDYFNLSAEQSGLMNLSKLAKTETEAIEILQQSLRNGWKDLFKLKTENGTGQQTAIEKRDQSKRDTANAVMRHYADRLASEEGRGGL